MADNFRGAAGLAGDTFAADEIGGVKYPRTKLAAGAAGSATDVSTDSPLPVRQTGALTVTLANGSTVAIDAPTVAALALAIETRLRAAPLDVTGALTNAQLRASAVPVSLGAAVALDSATLAALEAISLNPGQSVALDSASITALLATRPVTGPLTNAELRATAVPVSGPLTDAQLRATPVPVSMAGGGAGLSGPTSSYRLTTAASTNSIVVKNAAGAIHKLTFQNTSTSLVYLKLYNLANAPAPASNTPTGVWAVYPAQTLDLSWVGGRPCSAGVALLMSNSSADASTGAIAAGSFLNVDFS